MSAPRRLLIHPPGHPSTKRGAERRWQLVPGLPLSSTELTSVRMFALDGQSLLPVQDRLYKHTWSHGACHGLPMHTPVIPRSASLCGAPRPVRHFAYSHSVSHGHLQAILTRFTIISNKDKARELLSPAKPSTGRFCLHVYEVGVTAELVSEYGDHEMT